MSCALEGHEDFSSPIVCEFTHTQTLTFQYIDNFRQKPYNSLLILNADAAVLFIETKSFLGQQHTDEIDFGRDIIYNISEVKIQNINNNRKSGRQQETSQNIYHK